MSARPNKGSAEREFCPAVSRDGRRCDFAEHPGAVHWSWVEGELQFWQALPGEGERWRNQGPAEDPLRDAPQALRGPKVAGLFVDEFAFFMRQSRALQGEPQVLISDAVQVPPEMVGDFNPLANIYRDPQLMLRYAELMTNPTPKESPMSGSVQDLITRGRAAEPWNRPLVEATSPEGQFVYGLLESPYSSGHGQPVVHETVPESGGVPSRTVIIPDTLREVTVPGHRGGCEGDCSREGYSEETSYPECWTWDQIRTGIAERYRAWKDWVL